MADKQNGSWPASRLDPARMALCMRSGGPEAASEPAQGSLMRHRGNHATWDTYEEQRRSSARPFRVPASPPRRGP